MFSVNIQTDNNGKLNIQEAKVLLNTMLDYPELQEAAIIKLESLGKCRPNHNI